MNSSRLAGACLLLALATCLATSPAATLPPGATNACATALAMPPASAHLPESWSRTASTAGPGWEVVDDTPHGATRALHLADHGTHRYAASLTTPAFVVPPTGLVIGFSQRRDWSWANTAGVLEIAIGGRDFADIVAAGGKFLEGAYDGRSFASHPLGERPAWTAAPGRYVATRVRLPAALAGQSVRLRLRAGSAGTGDEAPGWFVTGFACALP
jgi:hypothetical protein